MNPYIYETVSNIYWPQSNKPIIQTGMVELGKFKGKREKHHELEFEINESAYVVLFDVEAYNYQGLHNDFNITILEATKCHISKGKYIVLNQIDRNELSLIEGEIYNHWEKNMPDNFYDELGEDTDCKADY